MPGPSALPVRVKPPGWSPGLAHAAPRAGMQSRALSLGPLGQAVLSPCHSAGRCQASQHRSAPYTVGWAAVSLSCSLAPRRPGGHGKRAGPQRKAAPRWLGIHSSGLPAGAVAEQSRGRRSSSSVRDDRLGPECTGGAPSQGPPLSRLQPLQVLQGHIVAKVVLILGTGREGTMSWPFPSTGKGGQA